ncbi:MAG: YebC/PmpR family DNA-binding transcriptional regulator, partial [Candidatus Delongbacteria bacterium]|nr:YebC/PmpR family DNA-binding transcriptional regulator [Candidatus Delongbacteria bacterium]
LEKNGSVAWMFHHKGIIEINKEGLDEDRVMEDALEAGAEDMVTEDENFIIYTEYKDYLSVCDALEAKYTFESNELTMIADNDKKVHSGKVTQLLKLIDALEEIDDVQDVYSNADIDEADMEEE